MNQLEYTAPSKVLRSNLTYVILVAGPPNLLLILILRAVFLILGTLLLILCSDVGAV